MLLINRKGEVKLFPVGYRLKGHRFKEVYIHRKEIETFRQQGGAITWEEYYQKVILPSLDPGSIIIFLVMDGGYLRVLTKEFKGNPEINSHDIRTQEENEFWKCPI